MAKNPAEQRKAELQNIMNGFGKKPDNLAQLKPQKNSLFTPIFSKTKQTRSKYLTVSQADHLISSSYYHNPKLQNIYVTGEISSFTYRPGFNKMQFITLSQKTKTGRIAKMDACMYGSIYRKLKFNLHSGINVNVYGSWGMYAPNGSSSLRIKHLSPANGVGSLQLALQQRKARLKKLGAFSLSHKKLIPKLPRNVAIITSDSGQAVHDTASRIHQRCPLTSVTLFPALVQGAQAPKSLIKQLKRADNSHNYDVIIIGRGGGAVEDLQAFNDEKLAWAIYHCQTPIISAVGHRENFSISDLVADKRAPVPAQAGNIATPDMSQVMQQVDEDIKLLRDDTLECYQRAHNQYIELSSSYIFTVPQRILQGRLQDWQLLSNQLSQAQQKIINRKRDDLNHLNDVLQQYSPRTRISENRTWLIQISNILHNRYLNLISRKNKEFSTLDNQLMALNPTYRVHQGYNELDLISQQLESVKTKITHQYQQIIQNCNHHLLQVYPQKQLDNAQNDMDELFLKAVNLFKDKRQRCREVIIESTKSLEQLNYQNVLKRGYSYGFSYGQPSQIISSVKLAKHTKIFKLRFHDGTLPVVVVSPKQAQILLKRYHSTRQK